ncbi:MAG: 6-pyruvoyl-tetrahydropterin synthase-related protein [Nanoarchaeota archaeon]
MSISKIPNKHLYLAIVFLGFYFIYRLIDQAKLMWIFPLDYFNDYSAHMSMLFFLKECGFHALCPYWYGGYTTFLAYNPGWVFFSYPLYIITSNVQITTYLSLLLIFLLSFLALFFLSRNEKFGLTKTIAFFLFLFANPITIGNFIRLGRMSEMFAWVVFLFLTLIIFWYRKHKLDKKFLFFIPVYTVLMFSHPTVTILSHFLILALLLIKTYKERSFIITNMLVGLLASSFWWVPYIKSFSNNTILEVVQSRRLLSFDKSWIFTNIAAIIIPLALLVIFWFYWKSNKTTEKILFFAPILILNLLVLFRIVPFLPVLKHIYPYSYLFFFIFFSLFFLFKSNLNVYPNLLKKILITSLIIVPLLSVIISVIHTPMFIIPSQLEEDTLAMFPLIEGKYFFLSSIYPTSYGHAYNSYGPIFYKLETAGGFGGSEVSPEYISSLLKYKTYFDEMKCSDFENLLREFEIKNTIGYDEDCGKLRECGLEEITNKGRVCLYRIPQ